MGFQTRKQPGMGEGGYLTVSKEENIHIMSKDDHYKFLRTVENSKQLDELMMQTLSQEYIRNSQVIRNLDK